MSPADLYNNIVYSIVKLVLDWMPESVTYVDWDAHSQIQELPAGSLAGPAGCGMSHEEEGIEVVFGIGVSTDDDPNLFVLRDLVSQVYALMAPERKIPIYDQKSGSLEPVSWMVMRTPVSITPVSKAEIRSVQFIEGTALLNPKTVGA